MPELVFYTCTRHPEGPVTWSGTSADHECWCCGQAVTDPKHAKLVYRVSKPAIHVTDTRAAS